MSRKSWIQIDGKLIPKDEYRGTNSRVSEGLMIIPDIEPFKSPVDGRIVNSRSALRVHNKELDVTHYQDFSQEYIDKRVKERMDRLHGRTKQDRADRIEHLKRAYERNERSK